MCALNLSSGTKVHFGFRSLVPLLVSLFLLQSLSQLCQQMDSYQGKRKLRPEEREKSWKKPPFQGRLIDSSYFFTVYCSEQLQEQILAKVTKS